MLWCEMRPIRARKAASHLERAAVDLCQPARSIQQPTEHTEQRRLTGSVGAEHGQALAGPEREIDAPQGPTAPEAPRKAARFDCRRSIRDRRTWG